VKLLTTILVGPETHPVLECDDTCAPGLRQSRNVETVRGSASDTPETRHLLAAIDHRTGVVLGQVPVDEGTAVTLHAEVVTLPFPDDDGIRQIAGTVQFKDGTTALGTPVPATSGFAFVIIDQLTTVGRQTLTAIFTPADPAAFRSSASNTVEVLVSPARA